MESRAELFICGILAEEYAGLPKGLRSAFRPRYFDSLLHMEPLALESRLSAASADARTPRVYLYGDCCPRMSELSSQPGCARTAGQNCCAILLGPDRYKTLVEEGVFFFMPEWLGRWKRIFQEELGLADPGLAREFMRENLRRLAYIDTGFHEIPRTELEEASLFLGLPWSVERAGLEELGASLSSALNEALRG